ncbi:HEAT repeat domain-containing protein [Flexithrix dorotheae]|uniref:HEAT repeat domain-containing protein n=1 Tax=Flexithrix dorotheae TaxID=70993 RepID=UPI0003755550|nr:HEAT repeat domain-containing protein [Flexithrix dorotheae]
MDNDNLKDKLVDFIEGKLPPQEEVEIQHLLAEDEELFKEYDQLRIVLESLENSREATPDHSLSTHFYEMLSEEKTKQASANHLGKFSVIYNNARSIWKNNLVVRIAASITIFLAGYILDKNIQVEEIQTTEIATLKEELESTKTLVMLSLLKQESASDRLQAVNISYEMEEADNQIINALIHTLNTDQNDNVRLAACEALGHYTDKPLVINALIETLTQQQDPEIQLVIIDLLVKSKEKRAIPQIRTLLETQEVIQTVRNKANEGIGQLL